MNKNFMSDQHVYETLPDMLQDFKKIIEVHYASDDSDKELEQTPESCFNFKSLTWSVKMYCAGDSYNFELNTLSNSGIRVVGQQESIDQCLIKQTYDNSEVMITEMNFIRDFFNTNSFLGMTRINFHIISNGGKPFLTVISQGNNNKVDNNEKYKIEDYKISDYKISNNNDCNNYLCSPSEFQRYKEMFLSGFFMTLGMTPFIYLTLKYGHHGKYN